MQMEKYWCMILDDSLFKEEERWNVGSPVGWGKFFLVIFLNLEKIGQINLIKLEKHVQQYLAKNASSGAGIYI